MKYMKISKTKGQLWNYSFSLLKNNVLIRLFSLLLLIISGIVFGLSESFLNYDKSNYISSETIRSNNEFNELFVSFICQNPKANEQSRIDEKYNAYNFKQSNALLTYQSPYKSSNEFVSFLEEKQSEEFQIQEGRYPLDDNETAVSLSWIKYHPNFSTSNQIIGQKLYQSETGKEFTIVGVINTGLNLDKAPQDLNDANNKLSYINRCTFISKDAYQSIVSDSKTLFFAIKTQSKSEIDSLLKEEELEIDHPSLTSINQITDDFGMTGKIVAIVSSILEVFGIIAFSYSLKKTKARFLKEEEIPSYYQEKVTIYYCLICLAFVLIISLILLPITNSVINFLLVSKYNSFIEIFHNTFLGFLCMILSEILALILGIAIEKITEKKKA